MITKLITDFSKISTYDFDRVFEFIMDFDTMDGIEFLCSEHGINILLSIPGTILVSLLTLSNTDYDHCIYIMPRQIITALEDHPGMAERYLEFFSRLVNRGIHRNPDIETLDICYADVIKAFNCAELLQEYYASMVSEIRFGL